MRDAVAEEPPPEAQTQIEKMAFNASYVKTLEEAIAVIEGHPILQNIRSETPLRIQKPTKEGDASGWQDAAMVVLGVGMRDPLTFVLSAHFLSLSPLTSSLREGGGKG